MFNVIQMISHDHIKYSYFITHIFNKFTNYFCWDMFHCISGVHLISPLTFYHRTDSQIMVHIACSY